MQWQSVGGIEHRPGLMPISVALPDEGTEWGDVGICQMKAQNGGRWHMPDEGMERGTLAHALCKPATPLRNGYCKIDGRC